MVTHIIDTFEKTVTLDKLAIYFIVTVVSWFTVILAIIIDFWDGVYTARKLKQRLYSHRYRHTLQKIGEYWRVLLIALLIDALFMFIPWYSFPYATLLFAACMLGIEISSMHEHIKRRKSALRDMPTLISAIIDATDKGKATDVIKSVIEYYEKKQSQQRHYNKQK